jgi:hypothetical protein
MMIVFVPELKETKIVVCRNMLGNFQLLNL